MKAYKQQLGFTLVEVLVATSIFVTATVLVADIFVRVNATQRRTQNIQEAATDARFALEVMSRAVRMGQLDYVYYGGTANTDGEDVLALKTPTVGQPIKYALMTDAAICPTGTTSCLAVCTASTCNVADWKPVTPQGINVTSLVFFIYPDQSPFSGSLTSYANNEQPRVTIVMSTESVTTDLAEQASFTLQTTISSRTYRR